MFRSISTVKADLAQAEFGITGKGIVWAVLGTGVSSTHPHFQRYKNLKLPKPLYHMDYSNSMKKITKSERRDMYQDRLELSDLLADKRFRVSVPVDRRGYGTAVAGIIAGQSNDRDYVMKGLAPEAKISNQLWSGGGGDELRKPRL
jgi:subtilisin family serine protease